MEMLFYDSVCLLIMPSCIQMEPKLATAIQWLKSSGGERVRKAGPTQVRCLSIADIGDGTAEIRIALVTSAVVKPRIQP